MPALDEVRASKSTSVTYGRSPCSSCSCSARRFWPVITCSTWRMVSSAGSNRVNVPSEMPTHSLPVQVNYSSAVPQ
jgi:hypothetical protein